MVIGFLLGSYSIVGNDAIQTQGTFLSSNDHRPVVGALALRRQHPDGGPRIWLDCPRRRLLWQTAGDPGAGALQLDLLRPAFRPALADPLVASPVSTTFLTLATLRA